MLGGDGTILRALQRYAGTDVPVFAINFGEIGFLATVEPGDIEDGIRRALIGDFELLRLPAIVLDGPDDRSPGAMQTAINDIAIHRKVGERVAELAYSLDGEEAGSVRCDGLVVATPGGIDRLQPRQRRSGDGVGGGGLRGVVHRPALDERTRARGRARRSTDDLQPLAASRSTSRSTAAPRARSRPEDGSRRASSTTSARSPSSRARRSTAGCARSSDVWRAESSARGSRSPLRRGQATCASRRSAAAPSLVRTAALHRGDEVVELGAREAPLAAGGPVAVDVAGVRPAAHGRERDAQVARGLGAREHELAVVAGLCGFDRHGRHFLTSAGLRSRATSSESGENLSAGEVWAPLGRPSA